MTIEEQLAESQKWVKYYRKDRDTAEAQVERLEAINAELLEACEIIQVSALKLAHMVFVCNSYHGRMNDIRGEVDFVRTTVSEIIAKAEAEL